MNSHFESEIELNINVIDGEREMLQRTDREQTRLPLVQQQRTEMRNSIEMNICNSSTRKSGWRTQLKTCALVFVIFAQVVVISGQNETNSAAAGGEKGDKSDLGKLCETDNDSIGQKLGCSCSLMRTGTWKGSFVADCTDVWLGYNDTMILPPYLNISRHVRKVDFSKNYLSRIDGTTFGMCDGVFEMSFYKNHIETVHNLNCSRLETLDLSWNHLKNLTMDSFKNLPKLLRLDLSHNQIIFLEHDVFSQIKNLRSLKLSSNPIGEELYHSPDYMLFITNLEFLEELDLGNTSIVDFPLKLINGTQNLKRLRLNNNKISFIPGGAFEELTNLQHLDLNGNLFETIPAYSFLHMKTLKSLDISKMSRLQRIDAHAFTGLTSLNELSCSWNHCLNSIDVDAFRADDMGEECKPKIVRLNDNNLNYMEFALLPWKDLEELDLYRNPWVCDCNLQWVSEYARFKMPEASMLIDDDFKCSEPSPLRDMPVTSVEPELLMCYSPAATIAGTIGIIVFCVVLVVFIVIIALGRLGILPQWLQKFNVCGSGNSASKYTRVHPKPSRSRRLELMNPGSYSDRKGYDPAADLDLEWDNGDIGPR